MRRQFITILISFPLWLHLGNARANSDEEKLWAALKTGNHVILIRHAETEAGIGDPPGFELGNCKTQRNLSETGREHAKRIGIAFQHHGVPIGKVLSSRWCRCVDTAQLAFGKVTTDRMLDSIFNDRSKSADEKLAEVHRAVQRPVEGGNLVLVTHNFNINAIAGVSTAPGEIVVMKSEPRRALQLVGRMTID